MPQETKPVPQAKAQGSENLLSSLSGKTQKVKALGAVTKLPYTEN